MLSRLFAGSVPFSVSAPQRRDANSSKAFCTLGRPVATTPCFDRDAAAVCGRPSTCLPHFVSAVVSATAVQNSRGSTSSSLTRNQIFFDLCLPSTSDKFSFGISKSIPNSQTKLYHIL